MLQGLCKQKWLLALIILCVSPLAFGTAYTTKDTPVLNFAFKTNAIDISGKLKMPKFDFSIIPGVRASLQVDCQSLSTNNKILDQIFMKYILPKSITGSVRRGAYKTISISHESHELEVELPVDVNIFGRVINLPFNCKFTKMSNRGSLVCQTKVSHKTLFLRSAPYEFISLDSLISMDFTLDLVVKP